MIDEKFPGYVPPDLQQPQCWAGVDGYSVHMSHASWPCKEQPVEVELGLCRKHRGELLPTCGVLIGSEVAA